MPILKNGRLYLADDERDPDWKPKKTIEVMSLSRFSKALKVHISQTDTQYIEDAFQVSVRATVPYGDKGRQMLLLDKKEAERAIAIFKDNPVKRMYTPPSTKTAQAITELLTRYDALTKEFNTLKEQLSGPPPSQEKTRGK